MRPSKTNRVRVLDDSVVAATLVGLHVGQTEGPDGPYPTVVLDAIRRSTNQLAEDASVDEVSSYVQHFEAHQLEAFARNIKGITHELAFVQAENTDGDTVTAEMFPETNHPGADVLLHDSATDAEWVVQLKATDSHYYAASALDAHPDIPVYATVEAADPSHGVLSSGMSDTHLETQVARTVDGLDGGFDLPVGGIAAAAGLTFAVRAALLASRVSAGAPLTPADLRGLGMSAGKAALRAAVLVGLGATPLAPLVGAYIAARLGLAAVSMFANDAEHAEANTASVQALVAHRSKA